MRGAAAVGDLNSLRVVIGNAFDPDSGDAISQFALPVSFCVTYTQTDLAVAGVDESSLAPYYLDPVTGERRTIGVQRTSFTPATATTPGQVCFATTHFTTFNLSGNAVPTATVVPTATPRPVVGAYSRRLFIVANDGSPGW